MPSLDRFFGAVLSTSIPVAILLTVFIVLALYRKSHLAKWKVAILALPVFIVVLIVTLLVVGYILHFWM